MFGVAGGGEGERQRLIRTGLLTPFGGTSDSTQETLSSFNGAPPTEPLHPLARTNSSIAEFDWLGLEPSSSFSSSSSSPVPTGKGKAPARQQKGRTPAKVATMSAAVASETASQHGNGAMVVTGNETEDKDSLYQPSCKEEEEEEEEEEESSYYTDEELGGGVGGGGRGRRKRRRKRILRELSSSDSEDELVELNWGRGGSRERRRKRRRRDGALDDGDQELYKMRIRSVECPCIRSCNQQLPLEGCMRHKQRSSYQLSSLMEDFKYQGRYGTGSIGRMGRKLMPSTFLLPLS